METAPIPAVSSLKMDHLPVVRNGSVLGLERVPYLCEKPYDGGPFLTYPIRENRPEIIPDAASAGKQLLFEYERLHPTPNKVFEAFCQTWLFFGLINELLGSICKPVDFVQAEPGGDGKLLSTSRLPGLIEQWMTSIQNGSSTVTYEHVAKCLRLTHATLVAAGPDFDLRVKICIASVGELFEHAANQAFDIGNLVLQNKCPATWGPQFGKPMWNERMERSGWCPSQIETTKRSILHLQTLYFLASMQDTISNGRHGACDSLKCVAYQTDLEDYATQHVSKACKCEELSVDMSSLDGVLKTGSLPLLRIGEAETLSELTMELVASQPEPRYLALSHVWADGLGNAKANALPRCQLLQLKKLTRNLGSMLSPEEPHGELLFWCDTMCCPTSPGESKDRVLRQMKNIYEESTCVLVLDASLRLYKSEAMGPEEICARILSSGWMRRLWTLQEAALPASKKRLWFQFSDRAVNFHPLWQQIINSYNNDWSRRGLTTDIIGRLRIFKNFFHPETGADLAMVDAALQHRSVSIASDEPLLIGTLLGLDVASILRGSDETRIYRMWSLMPSAFRGIPKSIIFRLGPRLEQEGYRWAPSSMLYDEETNITLETVPNGDDQGALTEHGLVVRLSGYQISFPQHPRGLPVNHWNFMLDENTLYMRDHEACWYLVRRRWPSADGDYLSQDRFSSTMRSYTNLWVTLLETDFLARSDSIQQTSTALVTKLIQESEGVKYVHSYMHIHVWRFRESYSEMFEAAYRCAQKLAESVPVRKLANLSMDEITMGSPEHGALVDALESEIQGLAVSGEYDLAMATARRQSGKDNDEFFGAVVRVIFIGRYAVMGPKTPNDQQWCVD